MRTNRLINLIRGALLGAFCLAALPCEAQEPEPGPGDQAQRIVFSKEIAAANKKQLELRGVTPPYWTPTVAQVREIEERLADYLQANAGPQHDGLWLKLTNYKLQYVGFSDEGTKMVYVNAFCRAGWDNTNRWLKELMTASAGGDCYFQLKYDMDQASYYELNINRESDG